MVKIYKKNMLVSENWVLTIINKSETIIPYQYNPNLLETYYENSLYPS